MNNLSHYGDILAIPFFGLLIIYFYQINHKTKFEYLLYIFAIGSFLLDIVFTYMFCSKVKCLRFFTIYAIFIVLFLFLFNTKEGMTPSTIPTYPITSYPTILSVLTDPNLESQTMINMIKYMGVTPVNNTLLYQYLYDSRTDSDTKVSKMTDYIKNTVNNNTLVSK